MATENKSNYEEDRRAILRLGKAWEEAIKRQDVNALLDMVTDDVLFMPPNMPTVQGKAAVAEMFRIFFATSTVDQTFNPEEIQIGRDWAFARGQDVLTITPRAGGTPVRVEARGISILRREKDGIWRFARGMTNTTGPPHSGPTSAGSISNRKL
jgi:uncharacterized protein (TIGR02246 family)